MNKKPLPKRFADWTKNNIRIKKREDTSTSARLLKPWPKVT